MGNSGYGKQTGSAPCVCLHVQYMGTYLLTGVKETKQLTTITCCCLCIGNVLECLLKDTALGLSVFARSCVIIACSSTLSHYLSVSFFSLCLCASAPFLRARSGMISASRLSKVSLPCRHASRTTGFSTVTGG